MRRIPRTPLVGVVLLGLAVALAVLVSPGTSEVAHSADVDISLDAVTILGADTDGDENTIEIPMTGNTLYVPDSIASARIVKELTLTVPVAVTVRTSGEFAPREGTTWHCRASFQPDAGGSAVLDQGCTVGSPDPHFTAIAGVFRGLPRCQWNSTTETGVAPKVVMPWIGVPAFKCERYVDQTTLVAAGGTFRAGGGAPGCRVVEQTPAAWGPAPVPNPYSLGDCILDWHSHHVVVTPGTVVIRVVDELELYPQESEPVTATMCEDFAVEPVGQNDPNLNNNTTQKCFGLGITDGGKVGGVAELPALAGASGDEVSAPGGDTGWSSTNYAALVGGLAVAAVAIGAGGWYARRRWLR